MNDEIRFERLFADGLHELAPRRAPDRLRTTIKAETGETRPRARWLALIKEPTMRTNNRVAVGSPTARVAAVMAATLLAAMMIIGAGVAGAQLLAANGPIIVDADGGGDFTTIQAAVDAAGDGDEILVQPGTYAEEVAIIEKGLTVRGDGPVDEIIVELAGAELFTLTNSDATVANLTLRGDKHTQGMTIFHGAPTISGVVFDAVGVPYGSADVGAGSSLTVLGGTPHVRDSRFVDGGEIMIGLDADAVIEDSAFLDGPHLYLENPGDGAIVRGNTFSGTYDRAMGLFGPSTMTIEGNTVDGAAGDGITVGWNSSPGHDPLIRDNDISGSATGIWVAAGAAPVISDNQVHGNGIGIAVRDSGATLSENTICDNERNLSLPEGAEPSELDASNTICGDAPAE